MKIDGKVFQFGDNINTDEIIPARYLNRSDKSFLKQYCMEDIRAGFGKRMDLTGAIFVAGRNFGCGSSREHAPIAIQAAGVACIIAESFARIFYRNCLNIGLPIVELEEMPEIVEGDQLEVDLGKGRLIVNGQVQYDAFQPYPEFIQAIIRQGGWLNYLLGGLHVQA